MSAFRARQTFAVPAGAGSYAPERLTLAPPNTTAGLFSLIGVTALIETGVTAAVLELWVLKIDGDPENDAHYFNTGKTITAAGGETWPLAGVPGAQLRAKSGGTAGSLAVSGWAD